MDALLNNDDAPSYGEYYMSLPNPTQVSYGHCKCQLASHYQFQTRTRNNRPEVRARVVVPTSQEHEIYPPSGWLESSREAEDQADLIAAHEPPLAKHLQYAGW